MRRPAMRRRPAAGECGEVALWFRPTGSDRAECPRLPIQIQLRAELPEFDDGDIAELAFVPEQTGQAKGLMLSRLVRIAVLLGDIPVRASCEIMQIHDGLVSEAVLLVGGGHGRYTLRVGADELGEVGALFALQPIENGEPLTAGHKMDKGEFLVNGRKGCRVHGHGRPFYFVAWRW